MPYVIKKRTDIPDGALQITDLKPMDPMKDQIYAPTAQNFYPATPVVGELRLRTDGTDVYFGSESTGLAGWFAANVSTGVAVAATGTITIDAVPTNGDTITINGNVLTATTGARTPGSDDFSIDSGTTDGVATEIAAAINDGANSFSGDVSASAATNVVTLTAVTPGSAGNSITLATDNATDIILSGATLTGGADDPSLSVTEAKQNAQDVLAALEIGNLAATPVQPTRAILNGAITTGTIGAGVYAELLAVIAGAEYTIPAGTQIQASGEYSAASGTLENRRTLLRTSSLLMSVDRGQLATLLDNDYDYKGATGAGGAAVIVVEDDGTFLTP